MGRRMLGPIRVRLDRDERTREVVARFEGTEVGPSLALVAARLHGAGFDVVGFRLEKERNED